MHSQPHTSRAARAAANVGHQPPKPLTESDARHILQSLFPSSLHCAEGFRIPKVQKPPAQKAAAHPEDSSSGDSEDDSDSGESDVRPEDSVSQLGGPHTKAQPKAPMLEHSLELLMNANPILASSLLKLCAPAPPPENPMLAFPGLESTHIHGIVKAMPKAVQGITPSPSTNTIWKNMRGYNTGKDDFKLRVDHLEWMYCSEHSPAFSAPPLPSVVSFKKEERGVDEALRVKQKAFGAPAHLLSQFVADMQELAIVPLREAAGLTQGSANQRVQQALSFLQGDGAALLGYALRLLAAHYTDWFQKRKDNMLKSAHMTEELAHALRDFPLGFTSFLEGDIQAATTAASQSANPASCSRRFKATFCLFTAGHPWFRPVPPWRHACRVPRPSPSRTRSRACSTRGQ
jgi:hypothetical protein